MTAYPKSSRVVWSYRGRLLPGTVVACDGDWPGSSSLRYSIRLDCGLTVVAWPENVRLAEALAVAR